MERTTSLRLSNIRMHLDAPEEALPEHVARALGCAVLTTYPWRILRKSLDARDKDRLQFVFTLEVRLPEVSALRFEQTQRFSSGVRVERYFAEPFVMPPSGAVALSHRPIIVGSGPGGLAAAYFLAAQGYCPVVLERGRAVHARIRDVKAFDNGGPLNPESNYLFGEGGAGTFSDGKLTCRGAGPDVQRILELFAECKGKPSVVYDYRPHLGSNRLPAVVKALRQRIENLGGSIHFSCRVEDLDIAEGRLRGVFTSSGFMPAEIVILATGHSARDTYSMLVRRGVPLVPKPFQMGVRIEQPQGIINRVQYGSRRLEEKLGAAEYTLVARGPHDLFTFCMCAGGFVIPSVSEPGHFCTNGMSLSKRDSPFANSGLVVTIDPQHFGGDDILAGVRLQQMYEQRAYELGRGDYACPIQWADDFLAERPTRQNPRSSYPRALVLAQMQEIVPPLVVQTLLHGLPILNKRWHGKFLAEATLVGPEARGSAPVRIVRDDCTRASPTIEGLYPVGEGAGYAGGIVSAAVDGLRTAKAIVAKYQALANNG